MRRRTRPARPGPRGVARQSSASIGWAPTAERGTRLTLTTTAKEFIRSRLSRDQIERLKSYQALHLRGVQAVLWRLLFGSNLNVLATIYNSDKWNTHWYTQHYQTHFAPLRRRRLNLLEIGIGGYDDPRQGGASLRMWRTYFPKARIFGIDIEDKRLHDERRIKTFRGSQADPEFLERVLGEIGQVDIIIDDGSHRNEHVLRSFELLFPRLAPNGIYAIEDTQTSYWPNWGGSSEDLNRTDTSMGMAKSLVDRLNHQELRIPGYAPTYLDQHVVGLHFYHNLVFIQKGRNTERTNIPLEERGGASGAPS